MIKNKLKLSLVAATLLSTSIFAIETFENLETSGQIRIGYVNDTNNNTTNAIGATLGVKSKPINGFNFGTTLYTTNAIGGKNDATGFTLLDENQDNYTIFGEAYLEANRGNTIVKVGRQLIDTPYLNSDDIGMVPNTYNGIVFINKTLENTTLSFMSLDKWSGIDSLTPSKFSNLQADNSSVNIFAIEYNVSENISLQAWQYDLSDVNYNYYEIQYESDLFNLASQYTTQGNGNKAIGFALDKTINNFTFNTAYNKVTGTVSNGYGGGPFFTSSEDHTVADTIDQKSFLIGVEYSYDLYTVAVTHAHFDKGENELDYTLSYSISDDIVFDLVYHDMNTDGKMTRAYLNYSF